MYLWQKITQLKAPFLRSQRLTNWLQVDSVKRFVSFFLVGVILSVAIAACTGGNNNNTAANSGDGSATAKKDVQLTIVSFAVTKAAHDQIIPKFV